MDPLLLEEAQDLTPAGVRADSADPGDFRAQGDEVPGNVGSSACPEPLTTVREDHHGRLAREPLRLT